MAGKWRDFFRNQEDVRTLEQIREVAKKALDEEQDCRIALCDILKLMGDPVEDYLQKISEEDEKAQKARNLLGAPAQAGKTDLEVNEN